MHFSRCLMFCEARFSCRLVAAHIAGSLNKLADDFSRDNLPGFL